jgi:hypothetical protein
LFWPEIGRISTFDESTSCPSALAGSIRASLYEAVTSPS